MSVKKKGLCGKKLLECKLRGPANFSNDTDCILSVNKQTAIKSNEVVAAATVWR